MKKIFALVIVGLSIQFAQASDTPDAYAALKAFYDNASQPASPTDLASIGTLNCVMASAPGVSFASPVTFTMQQNVTIPGIPAQGPVLPGTPDVTVAQCLTWSLNSPTPRIPQQFCANETMTITSTDLTFAAPFYFQDGYSVVPAPTTVSVRMNAALLAIKAEQNYSVTDPQTGAISVLPQDSYSYCY